MATPTGNVNHKRNRRIVIALLVVGIPYFAYAAWREVTTPHPKQFAPDPFIEQATAGQRERAAVNEYLQQRVDDKMRAYRKCMQAINDSDVCQEYGAKR